MKIFKISTIILLSIVFILSIINLSSKIYSPTEHLDESSWLHNAYFYKLFFLDKDTSNPNWVNFIAYDQPPVGKYILGFALHANNKIIDSIGGEMTWHNNVTKYIFKSGLENKINKDTPDIKNLIDYSDSLLAQIKISPITNIDSNDLYTGRITIFIFGILASIVAIIIGWYISKEITVGLLAGLLLINNPVTSPGFEQVLPDSIWCFFILVSILGLILLFNELQNRNRLRNIIFLSILIGLSISLAIGTKLIAVYIIPVIILIFIIKLTFRNTFPQFKIQLISLLLIFSTFSIFFILLNPFLYHDQFNNLLKMANHRELIIKIQTLVQDPSINSISERFYAISKYGIFLGYDLDSWIKKTVGIFYIFIFIVGIWEIAKMSILERKNKLIGPAIIISSCFIITYIIIAPSIHMQWERYFLPLVICNIFIFSIGTKRTIQLIKDGTKFILSRYS